MSCLFSTHTHTHTPLSGSDIVTRIFKSYGDTLAPTPTPRSAAERAALYKQIMALRGVMLLVRLTGQYVLQYVPQVCCMTDVLLMAWHVCMCWAVSAQKPLFFRPLCC